MGELSWHRTSDSYPAVDSIISMVIYREESARVVIYKRMRVAAVVKGAARGTEIYGPSLPGGKSVEPPGRPEPLFGTAVFWRYVE